MSASQPPQPSRRGFLRTGALALGSWTASSSRTSLDAQEPVLLPTYVADANGSGNLTTADERLVRQALFTQRGFGLSPIEGFDVRADVLGRGVVDTSAVDAVQSTLAAQVAGSVQPERRPITVAWHYGWYNDLTRPQGAQTVRFKGATTAPEIPWSRRCSTTRRTSSASPSMR